jgi:branched-chain amino acid transport system ATP-binding protein
MAEPKVLALDEPSNALAPQLAQQVFRTVEEISDDVTVVLVEQHVDKALELADCGYLLENGRIETEGTGSELLESDAIKEGYLRG